MTEMNYFALGFLWGIGRITDQKTFLVQYNEKHILEMVRDIVSPKQKIFPVKEEGKKVTYRLKLSANNPYVYWLKNNGYEGRKQNEQRSIPVFSTLEQEAEFFRGYFLPHHSFDVVKNKNRYMDRLRFYASEPILQRLNLHLHNDVCHILYYQSKREVPQILEYLHLKKEENNNERNR